MRNAKVSARKLARQGGLVYTLTETIVPESKDTKGNVVPAETKERTCMFTPEQLQTAQLLGMKVPAVGDTVAIEDSVNPTTGAVNEQWVNISL